MSDKDTQDNVQITYEKARQGDRFHPTYDKFDFINYNDWDEGFNTNPTCWKIDYSSCLKLSFDFPKLNSAAGDNYQICKDGL